MLDTPDDFLALAKRLRMPIAVLLLVSALGTLGYYLLWLREGGTVIDALYMTFITVATIGYEEVHPLGTSGRLLTMGLAALGSGSLGYFLSTTMEYLVSRQLRDPNGRRRMQSQIDTLEGHVILVGLGKMGQQAALEHRSLHELDLRRRTGVNVLAVVRSGETLTAPGPEFTLRVGDHLISLGIRAQLDALELLGVDIPER